MLCYVEALRRTNHPRSFAGAVAESVSNAAKVKDFGGTACLKRARNTLDEMSSERVFFYF